MRIPLKLVHDQLQVPTVIKAPSHRLGFGLVDFVVDTGSNKSMLGYGDAARLNIPESNLPIAEYSEIGGARLELRKLSKITLSLEDEAGEVQRFVFEEFFAGIPTKKDSSAREKAKQIPSILGLDFLIKTGLALYCNPSSKLFYLEK